MSTKNTYSAIEKERDAIHFSILDFLQKKHIENVKEQSMGVLLFTNWFGCNKWSLRIGIEYHVSASYVYIVLFKNNNEQLWVRYDGSINKIFDHIMTAIQN